MCAPRLTPIMCKESSDAPSTCNLKVLAITYYRHMKGTRDIQRRNVNASPYFSQISPWCVPLCVDSPTVQAALVFETCSLRAAMGTVQAMVVLSWGSDYRCEHVAHLRTCSCEEVADTTILVIQCDHCLFLSNSLELSYKL